MPNKFMKLRKVHLPKSSRRCVRKKCHMPKEGSHAKEVHQNQSLTSAIMYHVDALDELDIPLQDKHWHSLGWTPIPEPASWHPDPHIRYKAMAAAYKAGSDFIKRENLCQWTEDAIDVAKQAAYMFKGECEFVPNGCGISVIPWTGTAEDFT